MKYADQVEQKAAQLRESLDAFADAQRHAEKMMLDKRTITARYFGFFDGLYGRQGPGSKAPIDFSGAVVISSLV